MGQALYLLGADPAPSAQMGTQAMIDNTGSKVTGAEAPVILNKVRPKAPNYVRDIKRAKLFDVLGQDVSGALPLTLHYQEVIDGSTVTYWNCPTEYTINTDGDNIIEYNTAECSCVSWT